MFFFCKKAPILLAFYLYSFIRNTNVYEIQSMFTKLLRNYERKTIMHSIFLVKFLVANIKLVSQFFTIEYYGFPNSIKHLGIN